MSFILFILSLCIFTKIPFKYKFINCLNLISTSKNSNILLKNPKNINKIELNNTSQNKSRLGRESYLFIHTNLDSIPFKTYNSYNRRLIDEKEDKTTELYHKLRLESHKKIPHIKPDDTFDEINEYDMKKYQYGDYGNDEDDYEDLVDFEDPVYNVEDDKEYKNKKGIKNYKDNKDFKDMKYYKDHKDYKDMKAMRNYKPTGESKGDLVDPEFLVTSPPWKPADDVPPCYLLNRNDLNLSFDRWPENCFLRIKIFSYYKHLASLAVERIKLALEKNPNLKVTNPMALPMRRKRWCYMSSAFVDKRSKDLIEVQEHVRIVDILPTEHPETRRLRGLLMIPLPNLVSFDYWFEDIHKPVKSKYIHDLYRDKRWISKYFLYHRDKHKKKELIDKLTSPELIDEIPLKWKKQFKEDYYFYQLGELKKLYRLIVSRKAEDEARKFYNVKMPEIFDFGDIRFIGNWEDRQFDPDYSSVDKID